MLSTCTQTSKTLSVKSLLPVHHHTRHTSHLSAAVLAQHGILIFFKPSIRLALDSLGLLASSRCGAAHHDERSHLSAWMGSFGASTSSQSWLSTDWLLTRKAVPLYLLLGLWLVQRLPSLLERFFTPKATSSTSAWVVQPKLVTHASFPCSLSTLSAIIRYTLRFVSISLKHANSTQAMHSLGKDPFFNPNLLTKLPSRIDVALPPAGNGGLGEEEKQDWKQRCVQLSESNADDWKRSGVGTIGIRGR